MVLLELGAKFLVSICKGRLGSAVNIHSLPKEISSSELVFSHIRYESLFQPACETYFRNILKFHILHGQDFLSQD